MRCDKCKYWEHLIYDCGKCAKIREKIEVDLTMGWDGGYVNYIETESDFGCNLFEQSEEGE